MTSARLPKCARLQKRPEFRRVYDSGRRVGGRFFLCFFQPAGAAPPGPGAIRLGITVTTRVGKAVRRNRLKRIIREYFRRRRATFFGSVDVVVNARPQATAQPTGALWADLDHIFRKAGVAPRRSPRSGGP